MKLVHHVPIKNDYHLKKLLTQIYDSAFTEKGIP